MRNSGRRRRHHGPRRAGWLIASLLLVGCSHGHDPGLDEGFAGALVQPDSGTQSGIQVDPGAVASWGAVIAETHGGREIVLNRAVLDVSPDSTARVDIVSVDVYRPDDILLGAVAGNGLDDVPVDRRAPVDGTRLGHGDPRPAALLFTLKGVSPGTWRADSVTVDHTIDGRHESQKLRYSFGLCVGGSTDPDGCDAGLPPWWTSSDD